MQTFPRSTAVAFTLVLFPSIAAAQALYSITEITPFEGGNLSNATAINNAGQIAGYAVTGGHSHAFIYENGVKTDLGTFGGPRSFAYGINASGQVVGNASVPGFPGGDHAFVSTNGGPKTDLGLFPGGGSSAYASGINASGQIVGNAYLADNFTRRAFRYSDGVMTMLGTLGGNSSRALDINDSGLIVGSSATGVGFAEHAFVINARGVMFGLGTFGGSFSFGYAINNAGHAVGQSYTTGNAEQHAFHFTGEALIDLGTLGGTSSAAYDINSSNEIVGSASTPDNLDVHAVLFSDGEVIDLNALVVADSGWVLNEALSINDFGLIVGRGTLNGQQRGFLLTPTAIPEPSSYSAMGGLAALGFGVLRRRRV